MTCLINIVTSLLLISGTTAGSVADVDAHQVGPKSASPLSHSSGVREASGDAKTEASHVPPVGASVRRALELVGVSVGQADSVRRVVGLFDQAGLELPALVVRGSQDRAECGQHLGFHRQHETWSEIVLCKDTSGFERSVIVHELAHAWAAFELSDTNKAAFQQVRGWEYWHDYEQAAWRDNGTEQAAEVIAWGVYDLAATIAIDHHGCADLAESYRALTGLDPAQGLTTLCEPPPAQVFT